MYQTPFNKPYYSDKCIDHIKETVTNNHQSGDGPFSKKCMELLDKKYGFRHAFFTPSCTHALEMMALLLNVTKKDEIIVPSYTFVTTANAFAKYGAQIVCADSLGNHPNVDPQAIRQNISSKTRAVVIVHYAGWACDMDEILAICAEYNVILLEDAAQAIHSFYKGRPLGSFGAMSAFSFHETKNINCGEGGLLVINDDNYLSRAEIIREKGTNRTAFYKGETAKYEWVDIGSSYLLSEINVAYLYQQFIDIEDITRRRKILWETYYSYLNQADRFYYLPTRPANASGNYHIFYIVFTNKTALEKVTGWLRQEQILATTHYVPLHVSKYYTSHYAPTRLDNSEKFGQLLLRLPLYYTLQVAEIKKICDIVISCNDTSLLVDTCQHKHISKNINDIIRLKDTFWCCGRQSQREWIARHINDDDIHVMLYCTNELMGYGLIRFVQENLVVIDNILIRADKRNQGYGLKLMNTIDETIRKLPAVLLCDEKTIPFYLKSGWSVNNTITIQGKDIRDLTIMIKNVPDYTKIPYYN